MVEIEDALSYCTRAAVVAVPPHVGALVMIQVLELIPQNGGGAGVRMRKAVASELQA